MASSTFQIAQVLAQGSGVIHGVDSSTDMIRASKEAAGSLPAISNICTFEGKSSFLDFWIVLTGETVLDATKIRSKPELQQANYDKVFSNAAMHWILTPAHSREDFFRGVHGALKPSGVFCFEMGGMGNVAEMRTAILGTIARRVGLENARKADPWFFPDETWMKRMLEETVGGFKVERIEREYRPTKADEGGIEGWVRLMGKQSFDAVNDEEREACVKEACGVLQTVCKSPGGGDWIGYVRLRAIARKI